MERFVVVGGSAAGARAAQTAVASGFRGRIDVISRDPDAPYYRPSVSKQMLKGTWSREQAAQPLPAADNLHWHAGVSAVGLDVAGGAVVLDDGTSVSFDRLVLAGGCRPRRIVGVPTGARLWEATTLADVARIRAGLSSGAGVLVIGAGLIGSEVASTLASLGVRVTVVDPAPAPLARALGPLGNDICVDWHRRAGMSLRLGTAVAQITEEHDRVVAELSSGEVVEAEAAVVCVGVVPDTDWLLGSGVPLMPDGGIACDQHLVVQGSDVMAAAGDVASWESRRAGRAVRVEHWLTAIEQGMAAAKNLLTDAGDRTPFDGLPTFWTEQHDTMVHVLGYHAPDSSWEVVEGVPGEGSLVAAACTDGRTTGYLLVDAARRLGHYRKQLVEPPQQGVA
jgi:NADPH-dependent 2,4-dienoyl-CoA reductase/sulfur reductase-like enzyme